ncbi:MAG: hypothetical protein ACFE0P_03015 [Oceanicaulis sp.]
MEVTEVAVTTKLSEGQKQVAADSAQFLVTPQFALPGANLSADMILRRGDAIDSWTE